MARYALLAVVCCLTWGSAGAAEIPPNSVSLSAGKLVITFDLNQNGGITSLGYESLDVVSPNCQRPTIFAIGVPAGNGVRYLDNLDFAHCEHTSLENGVRLRYWGLNDADIEVTLDIREVEDHLAFRADVRCGEKAIATDLMYPMINDYESLSGTPQDDRYVYPQLCGEIYHNPVKALRDSNRPTFSHEGYPGSLGLQFHALLNQQGGLVMYAADSACRPKMPGLFLDRKADTVSWSMRHYFDEVPGFHYESSYDVRMEPCGDTWYDAADVYAAWSREQWWMSKEVARRPWLDAMPINANVHDNENWTRTLPSWIASHQPEMNLVLGDRPAVHQFQRWEHYGNWIAPDSFPPLGGEEAMLAASSAMRASGDHLKHLFSCSRYWLHPDITPQKFDDVIVPMAVLPRGTYRRSSLVRNHEFIGEFVNVCPSSPEYRAALVHLVSKLADYGHDVISMDIWPAAQPLVCHNPNHGHPPGLGSWFVDANQSLIEQLHAAAFAKQPEAVFGGEGMAEPYLPKMHLTLMRSVTAPVERDRAGTITFQRVPLFDYIYGDQILTWGGYATTEMPDCRPLLALQFVRGEMLNVEDKWHPRFFDRRLVNEHQTAHPGEPLKVFLRKGIQPGGEAVRKGDLEFAAALNDVQRGPFNAYFSRGRCSRLPQGFVQVTGNDKWLPVQIDDQTPAVAALRHPQSDTILWLVANGGSTPATLRLLPPSDRSVRNSELPSEFQHVRFNDADYLEITLAPLEFGVVEWE